MEFNFRAVDDRPSPPSSFFDHRSEPPFPSQMPASSVPSVAPCYANNGRDLALLDREREMMMREEIILHEIARRREIEFEVRRDILLLEREMAAIRAGFSFDCGSRAMPLPPHVHWPSQPPLPRRSSTAGPMPMLPAHSSVGPEPLALPTGDAANDLSAAPEANSDKLIVLDRPNPDVIGKKRKAIEVEPHPAAAPAEQGPVDLNKKPKVEWSCALCQVNAPTEKAYNAHLLGKKHMGMVKRLRIQNSGIENVTSSDSNSNPKNQEKNLLMRIEAENISNKYKIVPNDKSKDDKIDGVSSNSAGSEGKRRSPKKRKTKEREKCTFWCEMCQISCPSTEVMEEHKRGRKHMANLQKHSKSHEMTTIAPLITTRNSSEDIVLKPQVTDSTHEPNGMLPKAVIVSKQKALEKAYDLDKSDGPAS